MAAEQRSQLLNGLYVISGRSPGKGLLASLGKTIIKKQVLTTPPQQKQTHTQYTHKDLGYLGIDMPRA